MSHQAVANRLCLHEPPSLRDILDVIDHMPTMETAVDKQERRKVEDLNERCILLLAVQGSQ